MITLTYTLRYGALGMGGALPGPRDYKSGYFLTEFIILYLRPVFANLFCARPRWNLSKIFVPPIHNFYFNIKNLLVPLKNINERF